MAETLPCPKCNSPYAYSNGMLMVCPECEYEWNPEDVVVESEVVGNVVRDANGNVLIDGDSVVVIKDLPVKGASKAIKSGTKVKNIKLTEGEHNIDCKVDGFGSVGLKSQFVRKA